jgi:Tol biopolymer transport system component
MFLTKLQITGPVALAVMSLGWAALPGAPSEPAPPPRAVVKSIPKGPNRILIRREFSAVSDHGLYLLTPDGTNERRISPKESKFTVAGASLSPDGKHLAALVHGNQKPGDDKEKSYLHVRTLDEKEPGTDLRVTPDYYVWSADGTELACSEFEDNGDDKPIGTTHYIVNVKTKAKRVLKLPSGHAITGWTPDGKYFLTEHKDFIPKHFGRLYLISRDASELKALTSEKERAVCGRLSPDGVRVLYAVGKAPNARHEMSVLDIASKKVSKVQDLPLNAQLIDYCWSPDGKQIAYVWRRFNPADTDEDAADKETEAHLIVCDPDGKNAKTILTEKCTGRGAALSEINWR